jgi:hypothetical protein
MVSYYICRNTTRHTSRFISSLTIMEPVNILRDKPTIIHNKRLRIPLHTCAMFKPGDDQEQIFVFPKDYFTEQEVNDINMWCVGTPDLLGMNDNARRIRPLFTIKYLRRDNVCKTRSFQNANIVHV